MIPFGIPWKYIIIGLVALGIVVGVKSALAAYNNALEAVEVERAAKEFERNEKFRAMQLAEENAETARQVVLELERMNEIIKANEEEHAVIEERKNATIKDWKRRALALAEAGDKCINVQHPPSLLKPETKDSDENRDTEVMPAALLDIGGICTRVYRGCVGRLSDLHTPVKVGYRQTKL